MAKVKVKADGTVVIKTEEEAAEALEAFSRLKAEIDQLRIDSGLEDLEKDATAYKAAVQHYMTENDVEQIQCRGFHGTLVRGFYGSHWVSTPEDLAGEPADAISLQQVIETKFQSSVKTKGSRAQKVWMKITKRIVDQVKIEEAVANGVLTTDEIAPAWQEKEKQPYVRLFDDR